MLLRQLRITHAIHLLNYLGIGSCCSCKTSCRNCFSCFNIGMQQNTSMHQHNRGNKIGDSSNFPHRPTGLGPTWNTKIIISHLYSFVSRHRKWVITRPVPVISATTAKSHHIRDCSEEYAETITTSPGLVLGILARNVCGRH